MARLVLFPGQVELGVLERKEMKEVLFPSLVEGRAMTVGTQPSCREITGQMVSWLPSYWRGPLEAGALVEVCAGHHRAPGDMEEG